MKKLISLVLALCVLLTLSVAAGAESTGLKGEFTIVHFNSESDVSGTAAAFWKAAKACRRSSQRQTSNKRRNISGPKM